MKLKIDGCSRGNPGLVGVGEILSNSIGAWLLGFYAHLRVCSSTVTELEALYLRLDLAWRDGFREVLCEVDVLSVIHLLGKPPNSTDPLAWLIEDYRFLLDKDQHCTISHTLIGQRLC